MYVGVATGPDLPVHMSADEKSSPFGLVPARPQRLHYGIGQSVGLPGAKRPVNQKHFGFVTAVTTCWSSPRGLDEAHCSLLTSVDGLVDVVGSICTSMTVIGQCEF